MLNSIYNYIQHPLLDTIKGGISQLTDSQDTLINRVALGVILQIAITIPLFYLHHNLFVLGFVVGFVFDEQVLMIVEKVNVVYNAQRTFLEKSLFFVGGGFIAILTMPTSMIVATLYYSAQWGASVYQNSLNRLSESDDSNDQEDVFKTPIK